MTVIRALSIAMRIDNKQLERDLRKSTRAWRRYSRQVGQTIRGMARTASIAGGVIAVGITAGLKNAAQATDEIAKNARSTGLTIREYQRLAHAFDIVGVGAENMLKVFGPLTKALVYSREGLTTYIRAFNRAGLQISDLDDLTTLEIFNRVREGLAGIEDQATRLSTAQELLGRSGKKAGTLLDSAASDLARFGDELELVGGVIEGDAGVIENFNDQITLLKRTFQARFANVLIESLEDATGSALGLTKAIGDAVETMTRSFVGVVKTLYSYREEIALVITAILAWKAATLALALATGIGGLTIALSGMTVAIVKMTAAALASGAVLAGFGAALGALAASPLVVGTALIALISTVYLLWQSWDEAVDSMSKTWGVFVAWIKQGGLKIERVWLTMKLTAYSIADAFFAVFRAVINSIASFTDTFHRAIVSVYLKTLTFISAMMPQLVGLIDILKRSLIAFVKHDLPRVSDGFGDFTKRLEEVIAAEIKLDAQIVKGAGKFAKSLDEMSAAGDKFVEEFTDPIRGLKASPLIATLSLFLGDAYEKLKSFFTDTSNLAVGLPTASGVQLPTSKVTQPILGDDAIQPLLGDIKKSIGVPVVTGISDSVKDAISSGKFADIGTLVFDRLHAVFLEAAIDKFFTRPLGNLFVGLFPGLFSEGFSFHQGGIVPGVAGAEKIAKVQAGELILTKAQQASLMSRLDTGSVTLQVIGDVSRETERAVIRLLPQIAAAVEGDRLART